MSYPLSSSPLAPSLTSYSSLCIVQLPGVSVTLRAAPTLSQCSPSYTPHLTCNHTRRVLLAIVLATVTLIDIILAASYLLSFSPLAPSLTSYSSLCIVQLPGVSVTLRAALTLSQCSPSYSLRLTCNHTRRVLLAIVLAAGTLIDIILAASYSLSSSPVAPSLTSYSSLCIVQLPGVSVTLRAALTLSQSSPSYLPHLTCNHTRRVLLAIVLAAATLIDIILAASYACSYCPQPTRYRSRRRHPD